MSVLLVAQPKAGRTGAAMTALAAQTREVGEPVAHDLGVVQRARHDGRGRLVHDERNALSVAHEVHNGGAERHELGQDLTEQLRERWLLRRD